MAEAATRRGLRDRSQAEAGYDAALGRTAPARIKSDFRCAWLGRAVAIFDIVTSPLTLNPRGFRAFEDVDYRPTAARLA